MDRVELVKGTEIRMVEIFRIEAFDEILKE
jgi:hypothetical protein